MMKDKVEYLKIKEINIEAKIASRSTNRSTEDDLKFIREQLKSKSN